jgi:hypothetical protein
MSLGLILVIILVIALFGGFSGRFGGYGYGYGHGGVGVLGIILIVLVVLLLMGRIWSDGRDAVRYPGIAWPAAGALRGYRDTAVPMLIAAIGYWAMGFVGGWLLAFPLGLGAVVCGWDWRSASPSWR